MPTSKVRAVRDSNRVTVLIGVSSETIEIGGVDFVQDVTPVPVAVNPVTGAVEVEMV